MAVPKKRTSKSKKNTRQYVWTSKTNKEALKAISLAKSLLKEEFKNKLSEKFLGFSNEEDRMSKDKKAKDQK